MEALNVPAGPCQEYSLTIYNVYPLCSVRVLTERHGSLVGGSGCRQRVRVWVRVQQQGVVTGLCRPQPLTVHQPTCHRGTGRDQGRAVLGRRVTQHLAETGYSGVKQRPGQGRTGPPGNPAPDGDGGR